MLNVANGIPGKCSIKLLQLFSFTRCFSQGPGQNPQRERVWFPWKGGILRDQLPSTEAG